MTAGRRLGQHLVGPLRRGLHLVGAGEEMLLGRRGVDDEDLVRHFGRWQSPIAATRPPSCSTTGPTLPEVPVSIRRRRAATGSCRSRNGLPVVLDGSTGRHCPRSTIPAPSPWRSSTTGDRLKHPAPNQSQTSRSTDPSRSRPASPRHCPYDSTTVSASRPSKGVRRQPVLGRDLVAANQLGRPVRTATPDRLSLVRAVRGPPSCRPLCQ